MSDQTISNDRAESFARVCVRKIVEDLSGRGGIDAVWSDIDETTQAEIESEWIDIIIGQTRLLWSRP